MDQALFQLLNQYLTSINIKPLRDSQIDLFKQYYRLLREWNNKFNLTGIIEPNEVIIKHFADSLSALLYLSNATFNNLVDLGTGAGLPGIPLAIIFPDKQIILLESNAKKCSFLNEVKNETKLNVNVVQMRAEDLAKDDREKYDVVITRAAASFSMSLELSLPLIKKDGYLIYMSGPSLLQHIEVIRSGISELGIELVDIIPYELPQNMGKRGLLVFKKNRLTDLKFPRLIKKIKEDPLVKI